MRLLSWTIWVLSALLIVATLDALPDPPAVNPSAAQCKLISPQALACDTVEPAEALNLPVGFVHAGLPDTIEPLSASDPLVLTGQATDPSPPAMFAGRKPSFQS